MLHSATSEIKEEYKFRKAKVKKNTDGKNIGEKGIVRKSRKRLQSFKEIFQKNKTTRQNYKSQTTTIKNDNNNLLREPIKIIEQFRNYFDESLNNNCINGNIVK